MFLCCKKTLQYKNLPIGLPISSHLMHGTLWYVLGWNRMWRALMVGFRAWITGVWLSIFCCPNTWNGYIKIKETDLGCVYNAEKHNGNKCLCWFQIFIESLNNMREMGMEYLSCDSQNYLLCCSFSSVMFKVDSIITVRQKIFLDKIGSFCCTL